MKFLTFSALAGVCYAAAINPFDLLSCIDSSTNRIPPTTTTSAAQLVKSSTKGWATTSGGLVTSYDYNNASSTLWVFPTGSGTLEATKVIFEGVQVINISFVVVIVEVIDSKTKIVVTSGSNPASIESVSAAKIAPAILAEPTAISVPTPSSESTAASSSTTSAESTSTKQQSVTHLVDVGTGEGFAYSPGQLNASIGDTVRFNFLGRNHSVTQADLAAPCTYNGGFDTGLNQFNPLNTSGKFLVDFQVNVSTPLWFYCKQPGLPSHCGKGMVFALNPGDKFDQFQKNAEAQGEALTTLTSILRVIGNISSISVNAIDNAPFNSTIRRRYLR